MAIVWENFSIFFLIDRNNRSNFKLFWHTASGQRQIEYVSSLSWNNMCNIFHNKITNAIVAWTLVLIEFTYYFNNFFSNNWFYEQTCLCWIQKIFKIIFSRIFYAWGKFWSNIDKEIIKWIRYLVWLSNNITIISSYQF